MKSLGLMLALNGVSVGGMCHIDRANYLVVKISVSQIVLI